MEIYTLSPISFASNSYLLVSSGHAALVDPGTNIRRILTALEANCATLEYILLTHAHFDHMEALEELLSSHPVPVYLHESEKDFPLDPMKNASFLVGDEKRYPTPDRLLCGGEELSLGNESIHILHTPGHTIGSCCFLAGSILITGDTLFADGIGRTDLFSGDETKLRGSLELLKALPPSLSIYPGHGGSDRLGDALDRALLWF